MQTLLFLATVLTSSPCQCQPPTILPITGSVDVPTNVQIRTWWGPLTEEDVTLELLETGAPVPFDAEPLGTVNPFLALVPAESLAPATGYRVTIHHPEGDATWADFTTGDGPDETSPTLGGAALEEHTLGGACTDLVLGTPVAVVTVEDPSDDATPVGYGGGLVRVSFTGNGGEVETVHLPEGSVFLGDTAPEECLNNHPWPPDEGVSLSAAVLDWAGNASEEQSLTLPVAEAGGCGSCDSAGRAPRHAGAWAVVSAALAVGALAGRRRDRSRRQ